MVVKLEEVTGNCKSLILTYPDGLAIQAFLDPPLLSSLKLKTKSIALKVNLWKKFFKSMRLVFRALTLLFLMIAPLCRAQTAKPETWCLLKQDRVCDGEIMQSGWQVLVHNDKIVAAGKDLSVPAGTQVLKEAGNHLTAGFYRRKQPYFAAYLQ